MEYRHQDDNAWYDIKVDCDGETITINYVDFPQELNETYEVSRFKNLAQVEGFRRRFRRSSVQVQDNECRKICLGMTVCALNRFRDDEMKFYDAIVVQVLNEEEHHHQEGGGREECSCRFVLRWQHGPLEGMTSTVGISDICLTPTCAPDDPMFTQFLKLAKDRLENGDNVGVAGGGECSNNVTFPRNFLQLAKERIEYGDGDGDGDGDGGECSNNITLPRNFLQLAKERIEYGDGDGDGDGVRKRNAHDLEIGVGVGVDDGGDYDQCCGVRRSISNEEGSSNVILSRKSSVNVEAFWLKLRRQRKLRFANRTSEGKVHGRCKRNVLYHMNV